MGLWLWLSVLLVYAVGFQGIVQSFGAVATVVVGALLLAGAALELALRRADGRHDPLTPDERARLPESPGFTAEQCLAIERLWRLGEQIQTGASDADQVVRWRGELRDLRPELTAEAGAVTWFIGQHGALGGLTACRLWRGVRAQLAAIDSRLWQAALAVADPEVSAAATHRALRAWIDGPPRVSDCAAYVEVKAPPLDAVATVIRTEHPSKKGVRVTERARPQRDINRDYAKAVAERARETVDIVLGAVPGLDRVGVSVTSLLTHATLGHKYRGRVLSAVVERRTWSTIHHANVTAENVFRNFPFRFDYDRQYVLREVPPFRLTSNGAIDAHLGRLVDMDPIAFEGLVRDLLQRMGFEATLTQASHDGGVDVEAFNPAPIVGGSIIVQCKRYSNTIGAPVVRDLYGAVTHTRSTKGILITTSDFSPDARSFADGKVPIQVG